MCSSDLTLTQRDAEKRTSILREHVCSRADGLQQPFRPSRRPPPVNVRSFDVEWFGGEICCPKAFSDRGMPEPEPEPFRGTTSPTLPSHIHFVGIVSQGAGKGAVGHPHPY